MSLLIVVFPCLLVTLFTTSIRIWALDREFYEEILDDPVLFETALQEVPELLEEDAFQRQGEITTEDQANAALGLAFAQVLDADYVNAQANDLVDEVFAFFDDPSQLVNIDIDLVPIKEALSGEGGEDFARVLAENLPPCEEGQEPRETSNALPSCITASQTVDEAQASIMNTLPSFIEGIPDTLALNDEMTEQANVDLAGQSVYTAINGALVTLGFFALAFWVTVALVGGHNRQQVFLWLGIMMALPALMVLSSGLGIDGGLADDAIQAWDDEYFMINGQPATLELREAVTTVLVEAARRIADGFLMVGAAAVGIGFAFLALGIFLPQSEDYNTRTVSVPGDKPKNMG